MFLVDFNQALFDRMENSTLRTSPKSRRVSSVILLAYVSLRRVGLTIAKEFLLMDGWTDKDYLLCFLGSSHKKTMQLAIIHVHCSLSDILFARYSCLIGDNELVFS